MPGKHNAGGCKCCGCWDCNNEPTGIQITTAGTGVGGDDCCEFPVGTFLRTTNQCTEEWVSDQNIWGVTSGYDMNTGCYDDLCYGIAEQYLTGTPLPELVAACGNAVSFDGCGYLIMGIAALSDGSGGRPLTDFPHQRGWRVKLQLIIPKKIKVTIERVYIVSQPQEGYDTTVTPCLREYTPLFGAKVSGIGIEYLAWGYTQDVYEYTVSDCTDEIASINHTSRTSWWHDLVSDVEGSDDTIVIDDGTNTYNFTMCAEIASVSVLW